MNNKNLAKKTMTLQLYVTNIQYLVDMLMGISDVGEKEREREKIKKNTNEDFKGMYDIMSFICKIIRLYINFIQHKNNYLHLWVSFQSFGLFKYFVSFK